jgi:hypothetical protein
MRSGSPLDGPLKKVSVAGGSPAEALKDIKCPFSEEPQGMSSP